MGIVPQPPVLCGIDGSPDTATAADAAAAEALRRQVPLLLGGPTGARPATRSVWQPVDDADTLLDAAARRLRETHPGLRVTTEAHPGDLAAFLVDRSRDAALLAVGPGYTGGYDSLFERWLTHRVVTHAHCPVLVARPGDDRRPVVVGVDGSEHGAAAVPLAFEAAHLRRVPVRPVNVHCLRGGAAGAEAAELIAESLAGWLDKYPQVTVETEALCADDVASALLGAAASAGLVVVGSRGHTAITSLLLGSASRALVERAPAPVLVTHAHL